jgi:hypothetical protein
MHQSGSVATRRASWQLVSCALLLSGAAFACVLSDALTGPNSARITLHFSGDSVLVVSDSVPFLFTADLAGDPVNARFRYSIDDTTIVGRTPRGDTLIARRRGRTRLTAMLASPLTSHPPSLTVTLDVVAASISLGPAVDTLNSLGDTLALTATTLDAHGAAIAGVNPLWLSSDTTVAAFVGSGRLVARANGQAIVRAIVDNDTGTTTVTVVQHLSAIRLSSHTLLLTALTAESTLVATPLDARGNAIAALSVGWTSDASTIATVTSTGRVHAVDNGTTRIHAQNGAVQDTVSITVQQQATRIDIRPEPVPAIASLGDQVTLSASAIDSLGFMVAVPNKSPGWATLDPAIATVDRTGLVTGVGVGSGRVVAVMDAARDTAIVPVGDVPASIVIQSHSATLASLEDTLFLSATVRNGRGNLIQSPAVSWRSSDATIARVDTMPSPLTVAVGIGTARVIATAGSVADTCFVTVTNAPAFIDITQIADSLTSIWDSALVPVVIRNARGDTLARTSVQWSSDAPLIATVNGSGLVVARDTGQTMVRAKYGRAPGDTLRDSMSLRVFNLPASVVASDDRDTLTAVGQALTYRAEVRNARGSPIPGYPTTWSSTNTLTVSVSSGGTATATGYGSALVIVQAGGFADTVADVVVNPTRLIVDNGVTIAPRFGTLKRPYLRIQDGVNAADMDDTVFVRRGAAPYSGTIALTQRMTLLGDDSAFSASVPPNPLLLPVISHDTGAAGITAYTPATVVIKKLALRHTTPGVSIDARQTDLRVSGLYINPPGSVVGRIGRGISLDSASSATASITGSDIRSVRGYGIRVSNGTGVTIDTVYIESVDSLAGVDVGAGIRIVRGSTNTVRHTTIRGTQGPEILVDSSAGATITANDLAGRQRLVLLHASNGATIQSNLFDSRPAGTTGEVYSGGTLYEWAALEIDSSWQAIVSNNTFRDVARTDQEPFNAMRFVSLRNPSPPFQGAQLTGNKVVGTRAGIRSEASTLNVQASRFDSTFAGVVGITSDSLTLVNDTIVATLLDACVRATSAGSVVLSNSSFRSCTGAAAYAVSVDGGSLRLQQSTFVGNRSAVTFAGTSFTATADTVSGAAFNPSPGDTLVARGALDATAPSITMTHNIVTGHRYNAGIRAEDGSSSARLDSNFISINTVGVRLGALSNFNARDNDIFDNGPGGALNEDARLIDMTMTWWGDQRGPRAGTDATATGDSLMGNVTASSWNASPLANGVTAAASRKVRGDGQTAARGTVLPKAFTVRVVDAFGRPVAGVQVTFRVTGGGGSIGASQVKVNTNSSGLAEVTLTLGSTPGLNTVSATASGLTTLTFTATGT